MKLHLTVWAFLTLAVAGQTFAEDPGVDGTQPTGGYGGLPTIEIVTNTGPESSWGYQIGTVFMSEYYGTIFGGVFYKGPMSFTDVVASYKDGLGTLTLDLSVGQKLSHMGEFNVDLGNEYDLTIGHSFGLGTAKFPVQLYVGSTYLAVYDLENVADDFVSQTVRLDFPILADRESGPLFQPYAQIYHYNHIGGFRNEGWIWYAGLIRDQKLGYKLFNSDLVLNIDYRMGLNAGVLNSHVGIEYHRLAFSLPVRIGKWTLTPQVLGQIPGGPDQTYVHKKQIFGTFSVSRSF